MKERTKGFIAEDKIDQEGEIFDYIRELHDYLWRFVRTVHPGASGSLEDYVNVSIEEAEKKLKEDKVTDQDKLLKRGAIEKVSWWRKLLLRKGGYIK